LLNNNEHHQQQYHHHHYRHYHSTSRRPVRLANTKNSCWSICPLLSVSISSKSTFKASGDSRPFPAAPKEGGGGGEEAMVTEEEEEEEPAEAAEADGEASSEVDG
jgi:hypothetical protein